MGTFHDTKDPLHGITVVAQSGDTVYIGRCHERDQERIVLLGVDQHQDGDDGRSNQEFVERAAKFGAWSRHDQVVLPVSEVSELVPLNQYYRGPGEANTKATATAVEDSPAEVEAPASNDDSVVGLSPAAITEVQRLIQEEDKADKGLRLAVAGGGCSGLVYKVEFDEQKDGDVVIAHDGFNVYLDRKSTIYLRGVILDFSGGLVGGGFKFSNPNASNTCGCGESFSV